MTSRSDPAAGRRVLVAGGRGFVGSHVVRALVAAGREPIVFGPAMPGDRLAAVRGRYRSVDGSIADRAALDAVFGRFRPSDVISCVAHSVGAVGLMRSGESAADEAFAVNVTGHRRLLEAAVAAGVRRVVWTGSTVVYGPAGAYGERRVDETDASLPATVYGLTKQMAEAVCAFVARRHGLSVVGLRLPLVLGRGLWYQGAASRFGELVDAAAGGRAASVAFHDRPLDLIDVRDVAAAILTVLDHDGPLEPVYNLKGFEASIADFIDAIRRQRPDSRIALEPVEPPPLFPLIDGRRFVDATGFRLGHDLSGLVRDLLTPEEPHEPD